LDLSDRFPTSDSTPNKRFQSPAPHAHRSSSSVNGNGADTPRDLNARVKILELYTLHVLPRNNEWDYAREFVSVSPVLDDERREAFLQALASLQEEQAEAERHEEEERKKREEVIRRDVEEARRLRRENEERERRRVEEERVKREEAAAVVAVGEGDYGVEGATPTPTPKEKLGQKAGARSKTFAGQSGGGGSSVARPLPPSSVRKNAGGSSNAVAAPTFMSRASMVFGNLRVLIDEIAATFQTNPYVLYRTLAFIIGLLLLLSRKNIRERIARILGASWGKVKATAGMGTKVSYI
jgi:hypothetical protein